MPKNKPHKGLLKRVKITARGRIKLQRAWGRHLRSHKTGQKIRGYRLPIYAADSDAPRLRELLQLPLPKRRKPAPGATAKGKGA